MESENSADANNFIMLMIGAKNEQLEKGIKTASRFADEIYMTAYPQDSIMYRSFLTCDDPKGVVQCGTIRKYRTCSHKMKDKTKVQKTAEHLETSLVNKRYNKEEKFPKRTDGNGSLIGQSSLQLTQVSRGDQRLNMIDSWSSDLMYDEKSEDIAQHILKGAALDLQDSLIMLHRLQEASQHTTHFRRKQTEKPKRDRIDAKMIGGMQGNPFSELSDSNGLQRPQPCAGSSSSNCKEELKEVIEESLVRQNMFPKMITEGLDSASETFSTSSSQSYGVRTNSLSDPSFSIIASKVERKPSLIVKLMGLEEPPSRSFPPVMQKHLDGGKILNQKRSVFEKDMSKVRKNNSISEVNPEQRTQGGTLDTMHFKGLINKNSVIEPKLQVHHFNHPNAKQLIKTQCTLYNESVKSRTPVPPEELSMRKLKAEIVSSKTIKHRKGSSSTNTGKEMDEGASKRLNKEVVKLDAKGINPVEASSGKLNLFCHIGHTPQVNETNDRKWKVQTLSRKQPEKDISEPRIVARPQYQFEITSTKLRKPKRGSRMDANEISCLKSTGSNNISIPNTESQKNNNSKDLYMEIKKFDSVVDSLLRRKNQMKNQNPVAELKPAKLTVEQIKQGKEKRSIHVPDTSTILADELLMVCEADAYANKIESKLLKLLILTQNALVVHLFLIYHYHSYSFLLDITEECKPSKSCSGHDTMLLKSRHENDSIPINPDKEQAELKHFLLTNHSFIGHAKELFNLDVDCPKILQKDETNYDIANLRLYLDYANELSEIKSLQESQVLPSFLLAFDGNSRLQISFGRLVEEIYNAIENLKHYREHSGVKPFASNAIAMTEKDMKCNGMMNSIWERGWRHGFSADEAELVVNKIETLLVNGLIEELIINLHYIF
ncbi:hypothetical protein VNO77_00262 [Canavalia gladiata]|uniref:DUF4378 domain-containing protein n=1 Tax=Canavalia gladiata TaxID=3824 RepID=A0AAN9MP19_CANGL